MFKVAFRIIVSDQTELMDPTTLDLLLLAREVETEGSEEATNYDKFACFCKTTNNEKAQRRGQGVLQRIPLSHVGE